MIELHINSVAEQTLQLLKKLQALPLFNQLRLVGGTALALQLGHRNSVDLDLFGTMQFTREELEYDLKKNNLKTEIRSYNEVIRTAVIENVKVDFVDYSDIIWLEPVIEIDDIRLAGLKDIAAMKISAITGRGSKKDFIDLFFLLQQFNLEQLIEFYKQKFAAQDIFHVIRSLTYFDDAEEDPQPKMFTKFDWETAKKVIKQAVFKL